MRKFLGGNGRDNRKVQTYPEETVYPVIGRSSGDFSLALEVWATAIEVATEANARLFDADEWAFMARAFGGNKLPAYSRDPGAILARLAEYKDQAEGLGLLFFEKEDSILLVEHLAEKLERLSIAGAWAVAYSIEAYSEEAGVEWWTIQYRHRQARSEHSTNGKHR